MGDNCHIFIYEQGGSAFLAGVASRPVRNEPDGTMQLEAVLASIRGDNVHFPVTQLVCLEQTHNMCGCVSFPRYGDLHVFSFFDLFVLTLSGRVLPEGYIASVAAAVQARGVRVHVDGARIWNAAASSGQRLAEVAAGADSISVCLSKGDSPCDILAEPTLRYSVYSLWQGLGAPAGSLLVGSADFIASARRCRKALGGGMRQVRTSLVQAN